MTKKSSWQKSDLMKQYFEGEPHPYFIYNGFLSSPTPTGRKMALDITPGYELRDFPPVRVYIKPGTTQVEAMKLLKEIRKVIKNEGFGILEDDLAAEEYAISQYEAKDKNDDKNWGF